MSRPDETSPHFSPRDWRALALLGLGWLALPLLLGTGLDIPLNDDWAYAYVVRRLLETGEFHRASWTWVPALTHTAWGALFAWPLGFSFEALRWSSLAAGALGTAGAYVLARRLGAAVGAAALVAATYGWNPVHVHVAFTFMTEALFGALCIWALVFLSHAAGRNSWLALALGAACAVAATLSRQTGLALPAAFAFAVLIARWRDPRAWLAAALCVGVCFFAYLRAEQWLFETGGRWARLYSVRDATKFIARAEHSALYHVAKHGIASLVCLGWFLSPVLLWSHAALRLRLAASALGAALVSFGIWQLGLALPPSYNVIWDLGLGPLTIGGAEALPHAPAWLWWALTLWGAAAGGEAVALILSRTLPRLRETLARADLLVLLAFAAGFLAPHLPRAPFFDRYLLVLIVPLSAWLVATSAGEPPPARRRAAWGTIAAFGAFALIGTHDYFARSEAKWSLLLELRREGFDERRVVGGVEYNGWYDDFDEEERSPRDNFVWDDEVILSCAPERAGYAPMKERSFMRWLPPGRESVYALRRMAPGAE